VSVRRTGERAIRQTIARSRLRRPRPAPGDLAPATAASDDELVAIRSYIPITTVAHCLCLHVATLYRWTTRGCRGVPLRYVQRGATRCTTREWLEEFFDELTLASPKSRSPLGDRRGFPTIRSAKQFAERASEAGRDLDEALRPPSKGALRAPVRRAGRLRDGVARTEPRRREVDDESC
jgi:hypothetical protein